MVGPTDSNRTLGVERNTPRAIIHKQILDYAEANPDASMETIANAVSGATTATVERVLEEYGDPATDSADDSPSAAGPTTDATEAADSGSTDADPSERETTDDAATGAADSATASGDGPVSDGSSAVTDGGATSGAADAVTGDESPDAPMTAERRDADRGDEAEPEPEFELSSLTEKQRETLRAIYEHPDATQADLADMLGVSSPTISQRVNSIDGFDWANRHALVDPLFDSSNGSGDADESAYCDDGTGPDIDASGPGDDERTAARATAETRDESSDRDRRRADAAASRSTARSDDATEDHAADRQLTELVDRVDDLAAKLGTIERELEELEGGGQCDSVAGTGSSVLGDPELAHKIVHACVHSDRISEAEELRLLREVTAADAPPAAADSADGNSA